MSSTHVVLQIRPMHLSIIYRNRFQSERIIKHHKGTSWNFYHWLMWGDLMNVNKWMHPHLCCCTCSFCPGLGGGCGCKTSPLWRVVAMLLSDLLAVWWHWNRRHYHIIILYIIIQHLSNAYVQYLNCSEACCILFPPVWKDTPNQNEQLSEATNSARQSLNATQSQAVAVRSSIKPSNRSKRRDQPCVNRAREETKPNV